MGKLFDHHPWTVQQLMDGVDSGRVRLPDIQRPFVWSTAKVRNLIDSMYRGYPVGELMFWDNSGDGHTRAIGVDSSQEPSHQIVDGQQRLTSLYAVCRGVPVWREDYSRTNIRLVFNPILERFEVATPATSTSSEWVPDVRSVFASSILARRAFLARYEQDHHLDDATAVHVEEALNRVAGLMDYPFQVVQIGEDIRRERVAEIFVRINSEGVSLSASDFILTWLSVFWEEGREKLEAFARDSRFSAARIHELTGERVTWTLLNPYLRIDPGQLVRVIVGVGQRRARLDLAYNALRGRDPRTREIISKLRDAELAKFQAAQIQVVHHSHWDEFLKVLEQAGFRSGDMITSTNAVLYTYVLWLIGKVDFGVNINDLRRVLARWFFMAQITGRYTRSPESAAGEDISRLDSLEKRTPNSFLDVLNQQIDAALTDDWWRVTLPEDLVTSSVRAPAYVGYLAALCILDSDTLLSTLSVKDWLSPARRPVRGVEKHHLFPKGYLKKVRGIRNTKQINQVANYALVEWHTNGEISDDPPKAYWPEQIKESGLGQGRLSRQMAWHALPEGWTEMTYDEFLCQRRILIARVTQEAFRQLSEPAYQPRLEPVAALNDEGAAVAAAQVLPDLAELVESGKLPAGTLLAVADGSQDTIAEITESGAIQIDEALYVTPQQAARADGDTVTDGWTYWEAYLETVDTPVLLADLRLPAAA